MPDTVYSLSGEVPPIDPAGGEGADSALEPGALVLGSARQLCLVRKISAGGAVLHADLPAGEGSRLELDLATGDRLAGTVAWRRGTEVGLRFDEPIDVLSVLARNLARQPGERRRMPRVEVSCSALLEAGSRRELVLVRDISQGGVKIETPIPLAPSAPVTVTPEGLRPIEGAVRWSKGRLAGIAFDPELEWQELMPWLKLRCSVPDAPRAPPSAAAPGGPAATDASPPPGGVELNLPARVREGNRRWGIEVVALTARTVAFDCYAALRLGTLLWIVLPGLEGWPARVVAIDGYRFTCEFTQPLHPAVLERILAAAAAGD